MPSTYMLKLIIITLHLFQINHNNKLKFVIEQYTIIMIPFLLLVIEPQPAIMQLAWELIVSKQILFTLVPVM